MNPTPVDPAVESADRMQGSTTAPSETAPRTPASNDDRVGGRWIFLLVLAVFGAYIAYVTPIAISLAFQVDRLAPDNPEYLGVIISVSALAALVFGPVAGQLSDRTRTRIGRRRPWIIGGTLVGTAGLLVIAAAPSALVVGLGWVIAQLGWSQVLNNFTTILADRLPEEQRGRVSGLTGAITGIAPVVGALIGSGFATRPFELFLLPATIAIIVVIPFLFIAGDGDSRSLPKGPAMTLKTIVAGFVFNPTEHPDFAWNWIGRVAFFFGLTLSTTYTAYFFAERLGIPVSEIGGAVAAVGGLGVIGAFAGAIASGFLSDRLHRRKPFVTAAAGLFAIGCLVMVLAGSLPMLMIGAFFTNLGIGAFGAVDQALMLDVLPDKETEAGRYVNIFAYATSLPQALAPGVGSLVLLAGGSYTQMYVVALVLTLVGAALIGRIRSVA